MLMKMINFVKVDDSHGTPGSILHFSAAKKAKYTNNSSTVSKDEAIMDKVAY